MPCRIWGFHGRDYEECRLLGYKNPVRTSQETHYVSASESSKLMLCKIWGFHGSDYEECRLLVYKTPFRTSQETHNFSTTELSQLMLCKIWGFTAVTMKNAVFWDVTSCGSCKNVRIGWWRRYVPPKRRFIQAPRDVTSQKMEFFYVTNCLSCCIVVY
jgi:hypothetical protein